MRKVSVSVDFVARQGEIVGTAVEETVTRTRTYRQEYDFVYGRELPNGKFQIYSLSEGSIRKLFTMASYDMDWTKAQHPR